MQKTSRQARTKEWMQIALILLFCALTVTLDIWKITFFSDDFYNRTLSKILQQGFGSVAGVLLLLRLKIRLFGRVENWLYLLPCLLIALNNFQWSTYFQGKMTLARTNFGDALLFSLQCTCTGLFEEIIFRGVLFALLVGLFSKDKKGFLLAYVVSSLLFGAFHLFNGFSSASLLQAGYSVLTGGLFAFCLIKMKNILLPALVHGLYNFCGLLMDKQGLGTGVVFDTGTVLSMLIVSVLVGIFVLYSLFTVTDAERKALYRRLSVENQKKD